MNEILSQMQTTKLWQVFKSLAVQGGASSTKWIFLRTGEVVGMTVLMIGLAIAYQIARFGHWPDVASWAGFAALVTALFGFAAKAQNHKAVIDAQVSTGKPSVVEEGPLSSKTVAILAFVALLFMAPIAKAQTFTNITASSCIGDYGHGFLANGTFTVQGTDDKDNPLPANAGFGYQAISEPVKRTITNGSLVGPLTVPTPASSTPQVLYRITIVNSATKQITTYRRVQITPDGSGAWNFCAMNTGVLFPTQSVITPVPGPPGTPGAGSITGLTYNSTDGITMTTSSVLRTSPFVNLSSTTPSGASAYSVMSSSITVTSPGVLGYTAGYYYCLNAVANAACYALSTIAQDYTGAVTPNSYTHTVAFNPQVKQDPLRNKTGDTSNADYYTVAAGVSVGPGIWPCCAFRAEGVPGPSSTYGQIAVGYDMVDGITPTALYARSGCRLSTCNSADIRLSAYNAGSDVAYSFLMEDPSANLQVVTPADLQLRSTVAPGTGTNSPSPGFDLVAQTSAGDQAWRIFHNVNGSGTLSVSQLSVNAPAAASVAYSVNINNAALIVSGASDASISLAATASHIPALLMSIGGASKAAVRVDSNVWTDALSLVGPSHTYVFCSDQAGADGQCNFPQGVVVPAGSAPSTSSGSVVATYYGTNSAVLTTPAQWCKLNGHNVPCY